jgi:polyhydroxyalkanoate synthesis regulator phasin
MAIKLPDFLKGGKSRIFIVIGALVGVGFAIFIAAQFFGGGASTIGASRVAGAPAGLETVPGGKMSPEFYRAVVQANSQAAQQAKISGGSAVPTLINVPGEQPNLPQGDSCTVCSDEAINVVNDINNLARSGKLSRSDADKLIDMVKNNVSEEEYAATLNALVRNGRLSPDQARQLLEHYKKQRQNQLLKESSAEMDGYIKADQLPLTAANALLALQKSGVSCSDFDAEVKRISAAGKISPDIVGKLSTHYCEQRAKMGLVDEKPAAPPSHALADMMANAGAELNALIEKLPPDVGRQLNALAQSSVTPEQYNKTIEALIKEGKISTADGKKLMDAYKRRSDLHNQLQHLTDMKNKKVSPQEYADELRKAVRTGLLSPQQAATLLQEYNAPTAANSNLGATPGANVPGSADFAKLQQRLKAEEGAAPTGPSAADVQQFQAAEQEAQNSMMEEHNRRVAALATAMSGQAQQLISSWQPQVMEHKDGTPPPEETSGEEGSNNGLAGNNNARKGVASGISASSAPLIKAGTILFAVLDTAVNSDYPDSPVMATIVQGPFKGARLLGKLTIATGKERVSLNFTLMNMDTWMNTQSINAFAIDPDTAHTVLASSVDQHYLKRYGALFASSFVSGYADAIMQSGSTQTTGVFGTSAVTAPMSPASKIAVGVGGIGKALSTAVSKYVDTPPTVIVNSGVGLGILFMGDVTKDAAPAAGPGSESVISSTKTSSTTVTSAKGSAGTPSNTPGGLSKSPMNLLQGAAGMLNAIQQPPGASTGTK